MPTKITTGNGGRSPGTRAIRIKTHLRAKQPFLEAQDRDGMGIKTSENRTGFHVGSEGRAKPSFIRAQNAHVKHDRKSSDTKTTASPQLRIHDKYRYKNTTRQAPEQSRAKEPKRKAALWRGQGGLRFIFAYFFVIFLIFALTAHGKKHF